MKMTFRLTKMMYEYILQNHRYWFPLCWDQNYVETKGKIHRLSKNKKYHTGKLSTLPTKN